MDLDLIVLSIPIFFILIGLELLVSWKRDQKKYRLGDAIANIGCGIVEQTSGVFLKVFVIGLYSLVYQNFRLWDIEMNGWAIAVMFIGVDFLYYWAHRMSHEVNLFWIGHVVHHQSEDYNLSVALRQGALQKIFTAPFFLPLAVLGFSDTWFLVISAINTLYQFWIHTEFIGKLGWLEYILNTPSHHRVHHATNAQYIDKNHAGSLIIWDRMFGTFAEEQERPVYGITTPVETFNPIKAHWIPIRDLWRNYNSLQGVDKWRLLWANPGWISTRVNAGTKTQGHQKFDFLLQPGLGRYLLVQFVSALGFVAWFLFAVSGLVLWQQVVGAFCVFVMMGMLGLMAEDRINRRFLEVVRLATWPLAVALLIPGPVFYAAVLFCVLSFIWFLKARKN
jgi:alkylglycerol monooxygenase